MLKKKIEITFRFLGETKNNYTFEQSDEDKAPVMFPKKIYLNKSIFSKQPRGITLTFS